MGAAWLCCLPPMADGFPPEVAALSAATLRTFRTAFAQFDAASEGTIITSDLPLALRALSLNPSERELKALLGELVRGSAAIPFVLFCQIAARLLAAVRTPAAMARLFAQWDPSNTGAITHAAVREVFGRLSPTPLLPLEALDALIAYADPGETGMVQYSEFCARLFKDYEAAVKATGTP